MRISDWSSDVCSSDLSGAADPRPALERTRMSDSPAIDIVEDESTRISLAGRAALLMVAALPVLALYGFGIALPPLARAFADNPNAVLLSQLVGGVVGFALALSSPIVGWLIDRFSYRKIGRASCRERECQ